jgi:hypothetical protein
MTGTGVAGTFQIYSLLAWDDGSAFQRGEGEEVRTSMIYRFNPPEGFCCTCECKDE